VIAFENLSGGMGTAAFVAFLMSLCNQRFTATQYALLSAFASVLTLGICTRFAFANSGASTHTNYLIDC
jgi:hypothetical protein